MFAIMVFLATAATILPAMSGNDTGLDRFGLASYCREYAELSRQINCKAPMSSLDVGRCQLLKRRMERLSADINTSQAAHATHDPLWTNEHAVAEASGKVDLATCRWEQHRLDWRAADKLCGKHADIACVAQVAPACFRMVGRCSKIEAGP
jgi:hypothetical protein